MAASNLWRRAKGGAWGNENAPGITPQGVRKSDDYISQNGTMSSVSRCAS
jgi:hypothetical protein